MLSAMVETCLEIFLRNKARPTLNSDDTRLLFDLRGPLGDFSSKIFVAYAFNLFGPETRHDLDLIYYQNAEKRIRVCAPVTGAQARLKERV